MKASESIRKNRRTWAARPPWKWPYSYQEQTITSGVVNAPNDQPQPGEGESGEMGESADRQAEDGQAR